MWRSRLGWLDISLYIDVGEIGRKQMGGGRKCDMEGWDKNRACKKWFSIPVRFERYLADHTQLVPASLSVSVVKVTITAIRK